MHSALLAKLSPALNALVNNGMKESLTGYTTLPETDPKTFARFLEYIYTGDFESSLFCKVQHKTKVQSIISKLRKSHSGIRTSFMLSRLLPQAWKTFEKSYTYTGPILYDVESNGQVCDEKGFLEVVKVCILADYYGLDRLMDLSLNKIHRLMTSSCIPEDPLKFIAFCTTERCPERLRDLAVKYCCLEVNRLRLLPDFPEYLTQHPDVAFLILDGLVESVLKEFPEGDAD